MRFGKLAKITLCFGLCLLAVCGCFEGYPPGTPAGRGVKRALKSRGGREVVVFTLVRGPVRGFYPEGQSSSGEVAASVWLLDPETGTAWRLSDKETSRAMHPALSPDGRFVLYVRRSEHPGKRNSLAWVALDGKGRLGIPPGDKFNPWWPAFSPYGNQIAYSALPDQIVLQDTKGGSGKPLGVHFTKNRGEKYSRLDSLRWSPKGSYLAWEAVPQGTGSFLSPIFTVREDGTRLKQVARGHSPAWDPQGERLYFLVPAQQTEEGAFNPSLPAYIVSVRPDGTAIRNEVVFKAAAGLGTAFGVGEKAFYYAATVTLADGTVAETIVALDRVKKTKNAVFKAPPGYWVGDLVVGKTNYLEELKKRRAREAQRS
ncbi:TolB family protein [Thermodesulfitimonas sp.]